MSGFCYIPGGSHTQPLSTFSETGYLSAFKRPGSKTNRGPPKMASEWLTRFCQKTGKDSECPYILLPACLLSLSLSPSDFLDDLYVTFYIPMISRKGFWGSLLPKSVFYIQKPEGSKTVLTFLKNPFLRKLISHVEREPSFPHAWTS